MAHNFEVTMTSFRLWKTFFKGQKPQDELFYKNWNTEGAGTVNGISTLKFDVVVLSFIVYEGSNFWDNPNVRKLGCLSELSFPRHMM